MKHKLLLSIAFCAAIAPATAQFTVTSGDEAKNDTLSFIHIRSQQERPPYEHHYRYDSYATGLKRLVTPKDTFTCYLNLLLFTTRFDTTSYDIKCKGKDTLIYLSGKNDFYQVLEYIGLDGKKHKFCPYKNTDNSSGKTVFYIENQIVKEQYKHKDPRDKFPKYLRYNFGGDISFPVEQNIGGHDSITLKYVRRLFIPNDNFVPFDYKYDYRNMREARVTAVLHYNLKDSTKSYTTFDVKYYKCPKNYPKIVEKFYKKKDERMKKNNDNFLKHQMDMDMYNYYYYGKKREPFFKDANEEKRYIDCKHYKKAKNFKYPKYKRVREDAKDLDLYYMINGKRINFKKPKAYEIVNGKKVELKQN